jgi:hypothetical protein
MKKLAILFVMMFAVALWFGSTVNATGVSDTIEDACEDTCQSGELDTDIIEVSATSVAAGVNSYIKVLVTMCDRYDDIGEDSDKEVARRMVKYRLHIDHKSPAGDRYGEEHEFTMDNEDTEDDCETSSDDGVMLRLHKNGRRSVYGPGDVQEFLDDPYTLIFTVPYAGLLDDAVEPEDREAVAAGDVVHLWVDVQQKQICDRAPDTFTDGDGDTCAKPEIPDEVLSIKLN